MVEELNHVERGRRVADDIGPGVRDAAAEQEADEAGRGLLDDNDGAALAEDADEPVRGVLEQSVNVEREDDVDDSVAGVVSGLDGFRARARRES